MFDQTFDVCLFNIRFISVVSEYNHVDVKVLPIKSTDAGFVQRYQSMYML